MPVGLLDERDVPPGGRAELRGVVVAEAGEVEAVVGQLVPLLAGHFAGLAADAERGVGEESFHSFSGSCCSGCCLKGRSPTMSRGIEISGSSLKPVSRRLRRRRPGRISPVRAFDSWICTFGSATNEISSLAESPRARPADPQ